MNAEQAMVQEFHKACGHPVGERPQALPLPRVALRIDLIQEEMDELALALRSGDIVAAADALGDLLYVTYGCGVECGINLKPIFAEIHKSNMTKASGPRRADGKILKPADWQPPDLAPILAAQGAL